MKEITSSLDQKLEEYINDIGPLQDKALQLRQNWKNSINKLSVDDKEVQQPEDEENIEEYQVQKQESVSSGPVLLPSGGVASTFTQIEARDAVKSVLEKVLNESKSSEDLKTNVREALKVIKAVSEQKALEEIVEGNSLFLITELLLSSAKTGKLINNSRLIKFVELLDSTDSTKPLPEVEQIFENVPKNAAASSTADSNSELNCKIKELLKNQSQLAEQINWLVTNNEKILKKMDKPPQVPAQAATSALGIQSVPLVSSQATSPMKRIRTSSIKSPKSAKAIENLVEFIDTVTSTPKNSKRKRSKDTLPHPEISQNSLLAASSPNHKSEKKQKLRKQPSRRAGLRGSKKE